jgi:protein-disulfide isomerase
MDLRFALAAVVLSAACSAPGRQPVRQASGDVVATIGDRSVTLAQVDERALREPAANFGDTPLQQAMYDARRAALSDIIAESLIQQEAARRNLVQTTLYQQEVMAKVRPVTDDEVAAWYRDNPRQVQGAPFDQVRSSILSMLTQMRIQDARDAYVTTLKTRTAVRTMLEPPRAAVDAGNGPAKGPADAPIELIEFADFECPYCLAASPTIKRVLDTYGNRVRFVYRNFPLASHPNAIPAAEAAQCAHEQGQFWAYHDRLFGSPGHLSSTELRSTAQQLGLDTQRFDRCIEEHKYRAVVDTDVKAGTAAGVAGTPAFFINGRLLSGAQPYDAFKAIIEEELAARNR